MQSVVYAGNSNAAYTANQKAQLNACSYPTDCAAPSYSGLTTDAAGVYDLATEAAEYADRLLGLLDRQYISNPTCPPENKNSRVPTVRDYLTDGIGKLRITTDRLSNLLQVVQN